MHTRVLILLLAAIALLTQAGCGKKSAGERKSLESARERIADLEKLLAEREQRIADLKSGGQSEQHDALMKHRAELAKRDEVLADLRRQLSLKEKENLALNEVLDSRDTIKIGVEARFFAERILWLTLLIVLGAIAVFVSVRLKHLRSLYNQGVLAKSRIILEQTERNEA
jgi:hypothetical protein